MILGLASRAAPWALIGVAAVAGLQTYRLAREQAAHAATQARHAEQLAVIERAAREASEASRAEEQRRAAEQQEIVTRAQQQIDAARTDAAAAADAAARLRQRIATLTAGCRAPASDPAPAGSSPPADASADLLADVQRRLDEAADGIAQHADAARIAGSACERAYDALTPQDARP